MIDLDRIRELLVNEKEIADARSLAIQMCDEVYRLRSLCAQKEKQKNIMLKVIQEVEESLSIQEWGDNCWDCGVDHDRLRKLLRETIKGEDIM